MTGTMLGLKKDVIAGVFRWRIWSLLVWVCALAACAPEGAARPRFFWPPPPAEPKIEYVDFYQADQDVMRGVKTPISDAVFGKTVPVPVFRRPHAIASNGKGQVYVSDLGLHAVIVVDIAHHAYSVLKDSPGAQQVFGIPSGLAVNDATGDVYVSDSMMHEVHIYGPNEILKKKFGKELLARPTGLAVDGRRGRLYVVDTGSHQVQVFDTSGTFLRTIGERGADPGQFNFPTDVDLDGDGNLYVLDAMNARVQVLDPDGNFLRAFGERGTSPGLFQVPKSIAVSPSGHLYVTDSRQSRVLVFDLQGRFLMIFGGQYAISSGQIAPGGMYLPEGIAVDGNDAIWIADGFNHMIHHFQYLNAEYLARNPVLPGQAYVPPQGPRQPAEGTKRQDGM